MKTLIHAAAAVALAATALTPAIAEDAQDEIIVSPSKALENWRSDVSRDLSRHLDLADRWGKFNPDAGIVQVRFTLDENGRPTAMETYRSSGSVSTDRAAMWAVARLNHLDDAPVRVTSGTTFQANIIFAESPAQHDELASKLAWIERKRLAANTAEADVIALGS